MLFENLHVVLAQAIMGKKRKFLFTHIVTAIGISIMVMRPCLEQGRYGSNPHQVDYNSCKQKLHDVNVVKRGYCVYALGV